MLKILQEDSRRIPYLYEYEAKWIGDGQATEEAADGKQAEGKDVKDMDKGKDKDKDNDNDKDKEKEGKKKEKDNDSGAKAVEEKMKEAEKEKQTATATAKTKVVPKGGTTPITVDHVEQQGRDLFQSLLHVINDEMKAYAEADCLLGERRHHLNVADRLAPQVTVTTDSLQASLCAVGIPLVLPAVASDPPALSSSLPSSSSPLSSSVPRTDDENKAVDAKVADADTDKDVDKDAPDTSAAFGRMYVVVNNETGVLLRHLRDDAAAIEQQQQHAAAAADTASAMQHNPTAADSELLAHLVQVAMRR